MTLRRDLLNCNPDVTADLLRLRRRGEVDFSLRRAEQC